MKKNYAIFIVILLCSCNSDNSKLAIKQNTITGSYDAETFVSNEARKYSAFSDEGMIKLAERKSIYIFSENEINLFEEESKYLYIPKATFRYYIKNNKIYTCMPYVNKCNPESFEEHFEILSIDTIKDNQIIKLKSSFSSITLKKSLYLEEYYQ
jgi:hypothetical protein